MIIELTESVKVTGPQNQWLRYDAGKKVQIGRLFNIMGTWAHGTIVQFGPSEDDVLLVRESPEQIAALVRAARREERIRENAARLHATIFYGDGQTPCRMTMAEAYIEASELEDAGDQFFAAKSTPEVCAHE